jgi:hypothetical protein
MLLFVQNVKLKIIRLSADDFSILRLVISFEVVAANVLELSKGLVLKHSSAEMLITKLNILWTIAKKK